MSNSIAETVVGILAGIAGTDEVRENPELQLFDLALLDSLKVVELMVAFSDAFGVEISPAEFEREQWATPRRIVADIERRVRA